MRPKFEKDEKEKFLNDLKKLVGKPYDLLEFFIHLLKITSIIKAKEDENIYMQSLLNGVHQQFIDAVKAGRGKRLIETKDTFSGLVWTGAEGVKLGLADGFGTVDSVAREVIGTEDTIDFTPQEQLLDKLAGKLGASFGHAFSSAFQNITLR